MHKHIVSPKHQASTHKVNVVIDRYFSAVQRFNHIKVLIQKTLRKQNNNNKNVCCSSTSNRKNTSLFNESGV